RERPRGGGRVGGAARNNRIVLSGRLRGAPPPRHYGDPANNIHAVQLELAQSTYMDEFVPFHYRPDLAEPTRTVLKPLLETFIAWGQERFG
ncbi:N-formylglutamate deformylase, partial [Pseudomonas syringae]|nr:N-formylglutamate deformylase [Pseudomonas syringae]